MDPQKNKNVSIIGVPMDLGADRRGVDMGPSALRCACLQEKLEGLGFVVHDQGDLRIERPKNPFGSEGNLKYLNEIIRANAELCGKVESEMKQGRFPLVIGGDHSIAIGTIKGVLKQVERLGVIWFDAHADANTAETSPSGNIHGMSLAVSLGFGHPDLVSIGGEHAAIRPGNVAIIGVRTIDPGEKKFLKEQGVHVFTMKDIDSMGMKRVVEQAIGIASDGTDGIHLSLDMDGMDPSEAPGVGTPVLGGLSYRESHLAMEMIGESRLLVSAELVEVNPILDHCNRTAKTAVSLVGSLFGESIL
ncbi:arginase [Cohnella luojiensis]|uniref:Arginase n=1 Tax=Cohnella luojiensis TaxID=652876 RepID=A0A4Y8LR22_9BACL|nr:arginase [Cohnella luojiensis]TFE23204.1 arginase [Cohnella luojiensis]